MATIFFGSNKVVNGTPDDDSIIGNQPTGNINDVVYGHQGDDSITTTNGLFDSTVYGGQGNDTISDGVPIFGPPRTGGNVIYGNFGNDDIESLVTTADTIYGGQGDDTVDIEATSSVIYGNLGNDILRDFGGASNNFYGGQGNDTITPGDSNRDVIYGNFGNDLLIGFAGTSNSHEYGGQGDDTLVFTGSPVHGSGSTTNDVETGNLGNDLFIATNDSGGSFSSGVVFALQVNDIVTVTDFLQGNDKLSETSQTGVPFDKIALAGADATDALTAANTFYSHLPHNQSEYVFVYGGTAAGFLFYNGAFSAGQNEPFATSGMAILGANGENSVNASDITPFKPGLV
jgi:Ca2+-binding RTX toxin-like protein